MTAYSRPLVSYIFQLIIMVTIVSSSSTTPNGNTLQRMTTGRAGRFSQGRLGIANPAPSAIPGTMESKNPSQEISSASKDEPQLKKEEKQTVPIQTSTVNKTPLESQPKIGANASTVSKAKEETQPKGEDKPIGRFSLFGKTPENSQPKKEEKVSPASIQTSTVNKTPEEPQSKIEGQPTPGRTGRLGFPSSVPATIASVNTTQEKSDKEKQNKDNIAQSTIAEDKKMLNPSPKESETPIKTENTIGSLSSTTPNRNTLQGMSAGRFSQSRFGMANSGPSSAIPGTVESKKPTQEVSSASKHESQLKKEEKLSVPIQTSSVNKTPQESKPKIEDQSSTVSKGKGEAQPKAEEKPTRRFGGPTSTVEKTPLESQPKIGANASTVSKAKEETQPKGEDKPAVPFSLFKRGAASATTSAVESKNHTQEISSASKDESQLKKEEKLSVPIEAPTVNKSPQESKPKIEDKSSTVSKGKEEAQPNKPVGRFSLFGKTPENPQPKKVSPASIQTSTVSKKPEEPHSKVEENPTTGRTGRLGFPSSVSPAIASVNTTQEKSDKEKQNKDNIAQSTIAGDKKMVNPSPKESGTPIKTENVDKEFLEVDGKFRDKKGNEVEPFRENGMYVTSNCGKQVTKLKADLPEVSESAGNEQITISRFQKLSAAITYLKTKESERQEAKQRDNSAKKTPEIGVKTITLPNVVAANDLSTFIKSNGKYYDRQTGQPVDLYHDYGDYGLYIVLKNGEVIKRVNTAAGVECRLISQSEWQNYYQKWTAK